MARPYYLLVALVSLGMLAMATGPSTAVIGNTCSGPVGAMCLHTHGPASFLCQAYVNVGPNHPSGPDTPLFEACYHLP